MAILNVSYMSQSLKRTVDFKVILPMEDTNRMGGITEKNGPFKTLYLLHGFTGNHHDWVSNSDIYKLARDYHLAVVMPSGENSFYLDQQKSGLMYGTFVGKELVDATRKMFPLSTNRKDTYIGGLSMGGFGSLLIGARFPKTFSKIFSFSGAFILEDLANNRFDNPLIKDAVDYLDYLFGELPLVLESPHNPLLFVDKALEKELMPSILMICGTDDELYNENLRMRDQLLQKEIPLLWQESTGGHDWQYWNENIKKAITWCLERTKKNTQNN